MSIRPSKFQLKLLEVTSHPGTDMMSFKLGRGDVEQENHYLDYKAGQYAAMDLGTKEDVEGPCAVLYDRFFSDRAGIHLD